MSLLPTKLPILGQHDVKRVVGTRVLWLGATVLLMLAACHVFASAVPGPGERAIVEPIAWSRRCAGISLALAAQALLVYVVLPSFYPRRAAHQVAASVAALVAVLSAVAAGALAFSA